MSDALFVSEIPAAVDLVHAVRAGDHDVIRDILTSRTDAHLWALVMGLAAMVTTTAPDPERVLRYCCDVDTRLAYSDQPEAWTDEDLQAAMCVHKARTAPGARWVERGVQEHHRRREARRAALAEANARALALRAEEERSASAWTLAKVVA